MNNSTSDRRFNDYLRLIFYAAFIGIGLWFAYEIISVLILFFLAVVLVLVLNAPTMWLISKKIPRTAAALIVFFALLVFLFLGGWLVVPKIMDQVGELVANIPQYFSNLQHELADALQQYPSLHEKLTDTSALQNNLPAIPKVIASVAKFSFSLIGGIFLMIVFFSIVVYMLINPAPLIETYLVLFAEEKRPKAAEALAKASKMMVGWMWSNLVVGSIEAVAVFFFLTFMDVPGVWVWAGLALFAEMVPKLGLYIMAIPPVLIALSQDPVTALWVLVFYLVLSEITGDFLMPHIRASAMNLHPVSTLFVMLAMGSAFGIAGALIATPLTAFIKAYYTTFYLSSASKENVQQGVETVLHKKA